MANKRVFYLDIDGVLADLLQGLKKEGFPYPKDYFFKDYPEEKRTRVKALINDPSFLRELPAIEEGILLAKRLKERNLLGGIVTARSPISRKETLEWLDRFGIGGVKVFFTEEKWKVVEDNEGNKLTKPYGNAGNLLKSPHVSYTRVSYIFVDDNPFLANEIVKRTKNSLVYMPDYPYNRDCRVSRRVVRVSFISEVLERERLI